MARVRGVPFPLQFLIKPSLGRPTWKAVGAGALARPTAGGHPSPIGIRALKEDGNRICACLVPACE